MAYDAPHSIEHHRRLQNVEIQKHSSPPINFRRQPSHRSKCRSLSSLSILSSNSTTSSSSSLSSSNNNPQDHLFNQNIINNTNNNPVSIPSPDISFPSRIPFSWEKHPGIPKQQKQDSKKKLPLPPAAYLIPSNGHNQNYSSNRYSMSATSFSEEMMSSFRQDPFFMAMVECSKDKKQREIKRVTRGGGGGGGGGRRSISSMITSNLSDRIGMINMYGSCKSICAVSESSIIRLPSTTTYRKR